MLDIGWSELILIGVVALIVIGPKDLPAMFRELGRFTAKLRSMARDFSRAMEQAAKESGVQDVAKDLKSATSSQALGLNAMRDAANKFEKWDPLKNAATPTKVPPMTSAAMSTATAASTAAAMDAATATPAAPVGPETQALLDKQAARQAIVAESTERLRALNRSDRPAPVSVAAAEPAAKPKPRAKAAKPADPSAPKPPAKRKVKKADEA